MSELNNELNESEKIQDNSVSYDSFEGNESEISAENNPSALTHEVVETVVENNGTERLKLSFEPKVLSGGEPLPRACWKFGPWRGCNNILTINRKDITDIEIVEK